MCVLDVQDIDEIECPSCGTFVPLQADPPPSFAVRPWTLLHGRKAVKAYVESLGGEAREWLMALYVDCDMQLLAVDTIAQGDVADCPVPFWRVIDRAKALRARGFVLVHNHPSGDPTPSESDMQVTARLRYVSHELSVPLLDHLIIANGEVHAIGW